MCKGFWDEPLYFWSVSNVSVVGIFAASRAFESGAYKYWHIELADGDTGTHYYLVFPYTSAMFCRVVLMLYDAKSLNRLTMVTEQGDCRKQHTRLRVYDEQGNLLQPQQVSLPKITLYRLKAKHYIKDYSQRLEAMQPYIEQINQRVSTRANGGC